MPATSLLISVFLAVGWVMALAFFAYLGVDHAHHLKQKLIGPPLGGPLVLALWVQYGPHADRAQWDRIVAVRTALVGLIWRTRYVLAALGACAALMLVMNQGLDVLYAMVAHPWQYDELDAKALAATLFALGLTALSLWVLGFSCWLWSRLVLRVASRDQVLPTGETRAEDHLAKFWARLLGVVPALLVLGMVLVVLPQALVRGQPGPIYILLGFAAAVIVGSAGFIWNCDRKSTQKLSPHSQKPSPHYYASATLATVLRLAGETRLFGRVPTAWLPGAALILALACRTAGQAFAPALPTLTLPIVLCLVAFWLGVAGWISLYEESERVPWFVLVLIAMGLLGALGFAENHRVPLGVAGATQAPWAALTYTWVLGVVLVLVSVLVARELLKPSTSALRLCMCGLLLVGGGLGVMHHADTNLPPQPDKTGLAQATDAPEAMTAWLQQLCDGNCEAGKPVPIYIVAAEGGGIRSAYWTALVLERLSDAAAAQGLDFERNSFAMIGVSGGSIGLAVYRACRLEQLAPPVGARKDTALRDCIDRFGSADLLAPLVGAWFFEDAVARFLPQICEQPACGFMSRGLWFEGAMRAAVPQLQAGLVESRQALIRATSHHQPYLLLNSTWVESGERAVASELHITWKRFPGARDQLAILGRDLPLVTASHNSARFPFTNALGAVHTDETRCQPNAYLLRMQPEAAGPAKPCGHLADGGYFDNSGGHSAADLLHLLRNCLDDRAAGSQSTHCPNLQPELRERLDQVLQLRVILIHNGVDLGPLTVDRCRVADEVPDLTRLRGEPQPRQPLGLRQPICAKNSRIFIDALSPVLTAFNAIGMGSNGRLAAARPGLTSNAIVAPADLRENGPLYPLGWHLSPTARKAMSTQAAELDVNHILLESQPTTSSLGGR